MNPRHWLAMLGLPAFLILLWPAASTPLPSTAGAGWRDTGIPLKGSYCLDATHANTILVGEADTGTVAYDWVTGHRTFVNPHVLTDCGPNGVVYAAAPGAEGDGPAWRFSLDAPSGVQMPYTPRYIAQDGTDQVYTLVGPLSLDDGPGRLWASADGGLTWIERGAQFNGQIESLAVAPADAGHLTITVVDRHAYSAPSLYTLYVSPDAGRTWRQRLNDRLPNACCRPDNYNYAKVETLAGGPVPVNTVLLRLGVRSKYNEVQERLAVSTEDGINFVAAYDYRSYPISHVELRYTPEGLIRWTQTYGDRPDPTSLGPLPYSPTLSLSPDGGRTWQALTGPQLAPMPALPPPVPTAAPFGVPTATPQPTPFPFPPASVTLSGASVVPAVLFLNGNYGSVASSLDNGHTWAADTGGVESSTPYLPLHLVRRVDGKLLVYDLAAGKSVSVPVPASGVAGSRYFPQTGHNIGGVFHAYWNAHGGLAQFGYPLTEALREANPTDGRVYLVQYFERNRFEYHPEYAGTPAAVLLGLLGSELTAARQAAGDGAFNHFADMRYPGARYFPQTGHNLRNSFLAYWQIHGGLAVYGYPISEEFAETSPTDGRRYIVQYFERNRFEYHPEYRNTPAEVLLGLLGSTLLHDKGWR